MMLVSIAVGIICGILWNDARAARIVAIIIFILLSIYTLVIEIIDIIKGWMAHRAGSDILAVIAIISATLVGTFWAAWIIDLMVFTGGHRRLCPIQGRREPYKAHGKRAQNGPPCKPG